jgi:hypothetical protein
VSPSGQPPTGETWRSTNGTSLGDLKAKLTPSGRDPEDLRASDRSSGRMRAHPSAARHLATGHGHEVRRLARDQPRTEIGVSGPSGTGLGSEMLKAHSPMALRLT